MTTARPPVDLDQLRARILIEEDVETLEMLDCFINSTRRVLGDLELAVERRDWAAVRDRAHAAKGAAANASANHLAGLCRTIEEQAPGRDWPRLEGLTEDALCAFTNIGEFAAELTRGESTHGFSD